jgi:hypothetical protein
VERYRRIDYETAKKAFDQNEKEYGRADGANGNGVFIDFAMTEAGACSFNSPVEDANVFTTPWSAVVTYRRAGSPWQEQVCAENTREYYAGTDTQISHATARLLEHVFAFKGKPIAWTPNDAPAVFRLRCSVPFDW